MIGSDRPYRKRERPSDRRHLPSGWRRGVALIGAPLMTLSVCGVAAVTPAGTASASTVSASGPIVVGGVDAGFNFPGTQTGFEARIARFNKAGGLDGRKIKLVSVTDDQDSPSSELSDIQQLIQSDHVFAVTPVADDIFSTTEVDALSQSQTPAIGYGDSQAWCNTKWAISIVGCQESTDGWENTASIKQIIQASKKPASDLRVAMEGYDSAPAEQVSKTLGEVWQKEGAKVVLNEGQIPLTGAASQAPFVQDILATDPNVVFEVTGSSAAVALAAALKQAGYKGIIYNGSSYEPSALKTQPSVASALDGVYSTNLLPTAYDGTPAVKQELKDLTAIGAPADIEIGTDAGYWSADLLIQLLEATKARGVPVTPANLAATVAKGITVKPALQGGNGPLSWPLFTNQPQSCNATVQGDGTTYKLTQKFTCYNNVKVATLGS
jgi:ABC-type branched-subunit amino acid transport system substrate-binding protein